MQKLQESALPARFARSGVIPMSVIVAVRNEARNLPRCLGSLRTAGEVYVVDSQSTDGTVNIAEQYDAKVVQFHYQGGWPKKRQWALDSLSLAHDWVLLMDADEALTPELAHEISDAVRDLKFDGYYLSLEMHFLGRRLRHGGAGFEKLSLFRRNKGRFECRLREQDRSMGDMEVHEHVLVNGAVGRLRNPLVHHNFESIFRYIEKHNEYSNWEASVLAGHGPGADELPASLSGTQAQRRRWLKKNLFRLPGSPLLLFFYRYVLRFGFLDGVPGLIYCSFQAVQMFHTKAKIYELRTRKD